MRLKVLEAIHNGKKFRIEEDFPEVGVYLYVFDEKKCIKDYLQNTINDCKEIANEEFGVIEDEWNEVS